MAPEQTGEKISRRPRVPLMVRAVPPLIVAGAALAAAYLKVVRPRMLARGTANDEASRQLPGDDLVPEPIRQWTRAVTIEAGAEDIWPWLAQIGQEHAGFYSYEWLENVVGCDIHGMTRIVPEWQDIKIGDKVRLVPESKSGQWALDVAIVEPSRALVLKAPGDGGYSWAFVLEPIDATTTRLLVRERYGLNPAPAAGMGLLELADFIMERKMMLTIKQLAEANRRPGKPAHVNGATGAAAR